MAGVHLRVKVHLDTPLVHVATAVDDLQGPKHMHHVGTTALLDDPLPAAVHTPELHILLTVPFMQRATRSGNDPLLGPVLDIHIHAKNIVNRILVALLGCKASCFAALISPAPCAEELLVELAAEPTIAAAAEVEPDAAEAWPVLLALLAARDFLACSAMALSR